MKKAGLEFKVGIFVVIGFAVLVGLVFKTGDFYWKPGYTVRFIFRSVSGIDAGSPVRLAGVPIGEVKRIGVIRDAEGQTQVEAIAWITQGVFIEEDAEVRISMMGLLGEKYIDVMPGTGGAATLGAGGSVLGRESVGFEKITESGDRLLNKMEYAMDNVNELVANPDFKKGLRDTFIQADKLTANLLEATDDLKEAAKSARVILGNAKEGKGTIGRLFMDDTIAKEFEAFVKDVKAHPWKLLKKS